MAKNKKHHYVPKFLLRQFSGDKKRFDVFQIKTGRVFKEVSLEAQAYETYFYGKDTGVEEAFSKLESVAADVIRKIAQLDLEKVTKSDLLNLRQFIYFQAERTKQASNEIQRFFSAQMKPIIEKIGEQAGIPEEVIRGINFKAKTPQYIALQSVVASLPAIMDLGIKVLVNSTEIPLIISDSPVIKYNQFAEHHPVFCESPGSVGYALKGIQLFMPISPKVCIALFDLSVYRYGSPRTPVGRLGKRDVILLNSLQAAGAEQCLYWQSEEPLATKLVAQIMEIANPHRENRSHIVKKMPKKKLSNGKISQLILTHYSTLRIGAKFSFAQVIDNGDYEGFKYVPPRSKELVEAIEEYGKLVASKRKVLPLVESFEQQDV